MVRCVTFEGREVEEAVVEIRAMRRCRPQSNGKSRDQFNRRRRHSRSSTNRAPSKARRRVLNRPMG